MDFFLPSSHSNFLSSLPPSLVCDLVQVPLTNKKIQVERREEEKGERRRGKSHLMKPPPSDPFRTRRKSTRKVFRVERRERKRGKVTEREKERERENPLKWVSRCIQTSNKFEDFSFSFSSFFLSFLLSSCFSKKSESESKKQQPFFGETRFSREKEREKKKESCITVQGVEISRWVRRLVMEKEEERKRERERTRQITCREERIDFFFSWILVSRCVSVIRSMFHSLKIFSLVSLYHSFSISLPLSFSLIPQL